MPEPRPATIYLLDGNVFAAEWCVKETHCVSAFGHFSTAFHGRMCERTWSWKLIREVRWG